ncbi:MAG: Histidine kinase [Mucilaginibacter sp.]|nr:Histidine kinase [Mucilaginibacter sp.]
MNLTDKLINFNKEHRVISHLLFWMILLLIQLSSSSYYNAADQIPFSHDLIGDGTNLVAQIPAAYFLAYFIVPQFVYKQKYLAAFIYFMLAAYVICALSRVEVIHFEEPFFGRKHNPKETYTEIFTDIPKLAYVYFFRIFSVAFVFMFLKLLKDQLIIQKRTLSLEKEKAETELKLLKSQLNPHFLFNTLNNIYSLSLSNSPVTSTSIGRLSEILDYILYKCNNLYVPLSGEIALLNNYIGLEKLRYDERLKVNFTCNVEQDIEIAPLILLSIVENAFKHGAGNDIGSPVINIELNANNTSFNFIVSNSFYPKAENPGSIVLQNLKQQLELIYPQKHKLEITQTDTLFTVTLAIYLS